MRLSCAPLILSCLAVALAACSGPAQVATSSPRTQRIETGPLEGRGASDGAFERVKLDPAGIGWVSGFRAELIDATSGQRLDDAGSWHSDLRLDNGTRLLVATAHVPEVRFPAGFALPLGQILRDIPEAWRGASIVSMASAPAGRPVRVRTTLEYLPPETDASRIRRLYVLSLPLTEEQPAGEAAAGPFREGELLQDPAAHWRVPPGGRVTRHGFAYMVPVDCTVHYGLAHLADHAKYLRLTDKTEGKILWQVEPLTRAGTSGIASIPVFASDTGFPLYREHEYEIEVQYENSGTEAVDAVAVLYLFYRPPGAEEFSYPYPPEDPGAGE